MADAMERGSFDVRYADDLGPMIDPETGEIFAPRFDGDFLFHVLDAKKLRAFVQTLGNGASEAEVLAGWLRGVVKPALAGAFGLLVTGAPVLTLLDADIAPDVDARLRDGLRADLAPIGLEFVGLRAFSIDIDDESRARITAARG